MQDINQEKNRPSLKEPLTEREKEVLILIAQGLSNRKIAESLTISHTTVRFHVTNILTKLRLDNRTQAALYAIREELVIL
jgi:NarL family two-component system response regulator LiaR